MTFGKARVAGFGFLLAIVAVAAFVPVTPAAHASAQPPAPSASTASLKPHVLPHRALYRMSLDSVRNGSSIQASEGVMYFEWQDACDGWNVEQRLNLTMTRDEGIEFVIKSNFTTWESKDGLRYRFNYRNMLNGALQEEYRGTARLDGTGQKGTASYSVPERRDVKLPSGSYFPTAHTLALINAAIARKPLFAASVFDGTDEHGLSEVSAVIGSQKDVSVEAARTGLGETPAVAWPVRMAFFPQDKEEAAPEYEMDTTILPNGVSEFMLLDYGEFRLRGALEKVELLPKPDC